MYRMEKNGVPNPAAREPLSSSPLAFCPAVHDWRQRRRWGEAAGRLSSGSPWRGVGRVALLSPNPRQYPLAPLASFVPDQGCLGGSALAVWTLSSLAPLVELAMLQSGSRPGGPMFWSAVAPLVVPSICGGGSCPLALGLVAAVAALVSSGWVSSSLFLRLLARRS